MSVVPIQRLEDNWKITAATTLLLTLSILDLWLAGTTIGSDRAYKSVLRWLLSQYTSSIQPDTISAVLRTFVTAKASLVAIIFSILFVATQFVSSRYSPEFMSLFTNSRLVKYTFYFAVLSIVYDIILLFALSGFSIGTTAVLFGISIVVSVLLLGGIYPFMKYLLGQSTPIELLDRFQTIHTLDRFFQGANEAAETNTVARHPLHPVYDLTRNAMERNESAVALEGERKIFQISNEMSRELHSADRLGEVSTFRERYRDDDDMATELKQLDVFFGPVIDQYLTEIAQEAISKNYTEIYASSVGHMGTIGVESSKYSEYYLLLSFHSIHDNIILHIHDLNVSDSRVRTLIFKSVEQAMNVFTKSVKSEYYETYHQILPLVYEVMRASDAVVPKDGFKIDAARNMIFEAQIDIYKSVVEQNRDYLENISLEQEELLGTEDETGEWEPEEHTDPRISVLINSRVMMMATAAQQFRGGKDIREVFQIDILRQWADFTAFATKNPPQSSGVIVAQRFIEMLVHLAIEDESDTSDVDPYMRLLDVMQDGSYEVVEKAFIEILTNRLTRHDLVLYNTFRGLSRGGIWFPFPYYEYDRAFFDKMYFLRKKSRYYFGRHMRQDAYQAYNRVRVKRDISTASRHAKTMKNRL